MPRLERDEDESDIDDWAESSDSTDLDSAPVNLFQHKDASSIDLVVAFGGDGLVMHTNAMFVDCGVPPVMCFDFGSLGFLAPFSSDDFRYEVSLLLHDYFSNAILLPLIVFASWLLFRCLDTDG